MSFREKSLESENYLKSFLTKINVEFAKSLPSVGQSLSNENDDDPEIENLLLAESTTSNLPKPSTSKIEQKVQMKEIKQIPESKKVLKIEKISSTTSSVTSTVSKESKEYLNISTTADDRIEDEGNMFGEEIYDIMEIDNEEAEENIYLDDSTNKQVLGEDESDFILVNFKSSSEDLDDTQFVVEELYDDDKSGNKLLRRKISNRIPKEVVDKYAQSTSTNQHICTKCVKVFSTRTNLIRHIQSHDGYKPYVCEVCDKGFTQSGSLKQHMYIHSGELDF